MSIESKAVTRNDWPMVSPRSIIGRRDRPALCFFALWGGCLAASILLGLASIKFNWSGIPITVFGLETFVTVYPPLIFCTLLTIWFGFVWGFLPAYLATLVLALYSGMPVEWSLLFAFADPLGLLILSFGFRFTRVDPSLRGWRPIIVFVLLCFFGALMGSSGSFIWTFTNNMAIKDTVAIWQGWWIGGFLQAVFINGPLLAILSPAIRRWVLQSRLGAEVTPRGMRQFFGYACLIVILASVFIVISSRMVMGGLGDLVRGAGVPNNAQLVEGLLAVQSILWVTFGVILAITALGLIILTDWISSLEERVALEAAAKMEAKRATDQKARFLSTMSHEIRTPMNGVIGMTDLLRSTPLNSEQRVLVRTLGLSGKNLLRLINDSLDLTRLESGQLVLERNEFCLRHCMEEALEIVAPAAHKKGIELLLDMDPRFPSRIVGDQGRLTQVVLNLVGNAIKFSDDREIVIRAAIQSGTGPEAKVEIMVSDRGVGIAADQIDRLFQPFQQATASTAREFGGSGLGLSICRQLSLLMGGSMRCESEPGEGSRFWFEFRTETRGEEAEAEDHGGGPVWLCLANPEAYRIIGGTLEQLGVAVERIASPAEVESRLQDGSKPGRVVCDVELLEGEGGPGMAEFVSLCERREVPFAIRCDLAKSLRIGSQLGPKVGILHKPAVLEALRALAAAPVARRASTDSAGTSPLEPVGNIGQVLVADDNRVNIQVVEMMLGRLGVSSDTVMNGQEVLEALERKKYDLVLLDLQMPVMGGLEAARKIVEKYPESTRPRLAAMTANAEAECRRECEEAGITCFLSKPFEMVQLRALLVGPPGKAVELGRPETLPAR